jgi:uncharacterized protein DUF1573
MKRVLLAAAVLVFSVALNAQSKNPDEIMKLNTEKHDFGKIPQGPPSADFYFEITNISNSPIVVESAQASCGCTTPEVPKEPIAPGATAKLKVSYNALNLGAFMKTVTIKLAGFDQTKVVQIVGEVMEKAKYDEYVKANPPATPVKVEPAKDATQDKTGDKTKTSTKSKTTKTKTKSGTK